MNNSYIALLRRRPHYRNLWFASVVSMLGDWFNTIASVILVTRYTDAGTAVGALFLARALPPFLFGPVAGVVADRFNRRTVMIVADLLRALIVLGFLFVNSAERAWLIYVLTIAQFIVSAMFEPAKASILPTLVEKGEELLLANTLSSATWSAMLALGAAIGGFTAALFGVQVALIIDALTFVLSALFVWQIAGGEQAVGEGEISAETNGWTEFLDGLRYVRQHADIAMLVLVKALAQIGSADILIAIYAERYFSFGEEGAAALGLMFMAAGLGAIVGPVLGNRLTDGSARALQRAIGVGFIGLVLGWLIFGWAPTLPVAMLGLFVRFMGGSLNWTYSSVVLQMKVPGNLLGRVFSIDFGIFTLAMAISVWTTGVILDTTAISPRQLALIFGAVSVSAVLFWLYALRLIARHESTLNVAEIDVPQTS